MLCAALLEPTLRLSSLAQDSGELDLTLTVVKAPNDPYVDIARLPYYRIRVQFPPLLAVNSYTLRLHIQTKRGSLSADVDPSVPSTFHVEKSMRAGPHSPTILVLLSDTSLDLLTEKAESAPEVSDRVGRLTWSDERTHTCNGFLRDSGAFETTAHCIAAWKKNEAPCHVNFGAGGTATCGDVLSRDDSTDTARVALKSYPAVQSDDSELRPQPEMTNHSVFTVFTRTESGSVETRTCRLAYNSRNVKMEHIEFANGREVRLNDITLLDALAMHCENPSDQAGASQHIDAESGSPIFHGTQRVGVLAGRMKDEKRNHVFATLGPARAADQEWARTSRQANPDRQVSLRTQGALPKAAP